MQLRGLYHMRLHTRLHVRPPVRRRIPRRVNRSITDKIYRGTYLEDQLRIVADLFLYSSTKWASYDIKKKILTGRGYGDECGRVGDDGVAGGGHPGFYSEEGDAVGYVAIRDCGVYVPARPVGRGDSDDEAGGSE